MDEQPYKGRQQFVQINENKSKLMDIVRGVPQGSVLGPKCLFRNN